MHQFFYSLVESKLSPRKEIMALDIFAGSVAGASGILAGYPFDTVKGSDANSEFFTKIFRTNK